MRPPKRNSGWLRSRCCIPRCARSSRNCALGEAQTGFEEFLGERLSPEYQGRIAELAVGPLVDDPVSARKLAEDYILALSRRQTRREVDELKRGAHSATAPGSSNDDAAAAAQAVIVLKKRDERERRNAS